MNKDDQHRKELEEMRRNIERLLKRENERSRDRQILASLGIAFDAQASDSEELPGMTPEALDFYGGPLK